MLFEIFLPFASLLFRFFFATGVCCPIFLPQPLNSMSETLTPQYFFYSRILAPPPVPNPALFVRITVLQVRKSFLENELRYVRKWGRDGPEKGRAYERHFDAVSPSTYKFWCAGGGFLGANWAMRKLLTNTKAPAKINGIGGFPVGKHFPYTYRFSCRSAEEKYLKRGVFFGYGYVASSSFFLSRFSHPKMRG